MIERADYDSWRDDPSPEPVERGHGFALGGHGTHHRVRVQARWRAVLGQRVRLALVDLGLIVFAGLMVFVAAVTRWLPLFVLAVVVIGFVSLWFRHQRMEHERRPR